MEQNQKQDDRYPKIRIRFQWSKPTQQKIKYRWQNEWHNWRGQIQGTINQLFSEFVTEEYKTLVGDVSPTFQTCHQHIWSPESVSNIDVTILYSISGIIVQL